MKKVVNVKELFENYKEKYFERNNYSSLSINENSDESSSSSDDDEDRYKVFYPRKNIKKIHDKIPLEETNHPSCFEESSDQCLFASEEDNGEEETNNKTKKTPTLLELFLAETPDVLLPDDSVKNKKENNRYAFFDESSDELPSDDTEEDDTNTIYSYNKEYYTKLDEDEDYDPIKDYVQTSHATNIHFENEIREDMRFLLYANTLTINPLEEETPEKSQKLLCFEKSPFACYLRWHLLFPLISFIKKSAHAKVTKALLYQLNTHLILLQSYFQRKKTNFIISPTIKRFFTKKINHDVLVEALTVTCVILEELEDFCMERVFGKLIKTQIPDLFNQVKKTLEKLYKNKAVLDITEGMQNLNIKEEDMVPLGPIEIEQYVTIPKNEDEPFIFDCCSVM